MSGVRKLLKALKSGEAVGMLPDQAPKAGEGVWAPFFGRPAYTMTLAARLAQTGATVLLAYRRAPALWCRLSPACCCAPAGDVTTPADVNREIERLVDDVPRAVSVGLQPLQGKAGAPTMTRLALMLMWLLHWLPLAGAGGLRPSASAGCSIYLGRARRHITLTNLGLCFPQLTAAEKSALARRHFEAFGRSFLERGLLWWASAERIRRLVQDRRRWSIWTRSRARPVILLVPHFVGLDMAWTRLCMDHDMSGIYASQKNPLFDAVLFTRGARASASR